LADALPVRSRFLVARRPEQFLQGGALVAVEPDGDGLELPVRVRELRLDDAVPPHALRGTGAPDDLGGRIRGLSGAVVRPESARVVRAGVRAPPLEVAPSVLDLS